MYPEQESGHVTPSWDIQEGFFYGYFMKKILVFTAIILFVFLGIKIIRDTYQSTKTPFVLQTVEQVIPMVQLTLDDGEKIATYSNISAQTPFEALNKVTTKEQIPITTKQYDFGIFVESVNKKDMTKDKTWIYYVNGKSGEVASDKYTLRQNDVVEWKYTTPIY